LCNSDPKGCPEQTMPLRKQIRAKRNVHDIMSTGVV
jgi:hypothetical protein